MKVLKISKSSVTKIPFTSKGQQFYRDKELTGFGLYVGAASKTYYAEKRINGKTTRVTIGKHGQITPEQARKEAQKLLGVMSTGINPLDEKKAEIVKGITLSQAYDDFKTARKNLKPKTLYDYDRIMETALKGWKRKPLIQITKEMVSRKHQKLGEESGPAYANLSMRFFRSVVNFAMDQYEDSKGNPIIRENPVRRLSKTRAWYRVGRRQTVLQSHQLKNWYEAVNQLDNPTIKDFLIVLLFTGLRRREAEQLKWEEIDFKAKTLTIPDTKNNEPLTLPLSNFLFDLLQKRKTNTSSDFVFPGDGVTGHLIEPRAQIQQVREVTDIHFTIHDLRRTFITIAESLDLSAYALKQLINHKMSGDVTAGYIVSDPERLRKPMKVITDHFLYLVGEKISGKIVNLQTKISN